MNGKKFDEGKARFDLVVPEFTAALARIMAMGAEKYDANNWQKVDDLKARYAAALHRHINAWQQGEQQDEESEEHHLAHAAANLMFLFWNEEVNNEDTDVQRHCSEGYPVDPRTGTTGPICDATDDDQEVRALRSCIKGFISILNTSGAHKSSRACVYDILDIWGFTKLACTVNAPQNE